jgi:membrane-bound lytic murein transglycosylase MltF
VKAPIAPSPMPAPSGPLSMLSYGLWLVGPPSVLAAEDAPTSELETLGEKLRLVVVDKSNVERYRQRMHTLLDLTAARAMHSDPIAPDYRKDYVMLVRAVAWQESCWRQFVRRGDHVRYLLSPTGDIGLMQVNKYVWRGMFSLPRLEWDIVYNAGAGAEILRKLAQQVTADGVKRGNRGAFARSVYAAYNGGPDEYDRWRRADEPSQKREIDQAFWRKYRAVKEGQSFDIMSCAANWERTHR